MIGIHFKNNYVGNNLNGFLENPKGYMPGTKMSFAGLSNPQDRANIILYMRQQGGGPALPTPAAAEAPATDAAEAAAAGDPTAAAGPATTAGADAAGAVAAGPGAAVGASGSRGLGAGQCRAQGAFRNREYAPVIPEYQRVSQHNRWHQYPMLARFPIHGCALTTQ